jgi:hypothetical protein
MDGPRSEAGTDLQRLPNVLDEERLIRVLAIGHRRDLYRRR